jgi:hypothetical protein
MSIWSKCTSSGEPIRKHVARTYCFEANCGHIPNSSSILTDLANADNRTLFAQFAIINLLSTTLRMHKKNSPWIAAYTIDHYFFS